MSLQKPALDPLISAPDSNEYFNSISHLVGAILSISALAVLVTLAAVAGKPAHVVGFTIYGVSLFLSFLFSCLLHFFLLFGKYLRVFGILDHNAIYILIAGTYTPFCLTIFSGATGWVLFGVEHALAGFLDQFGDVDAHSAGERGRRRDRQFAQLADKLVGLDRLLGGGGICIGVSRQAHAGHAGGAHHLQELALAQAHDKC